MKIKKGIKIYNNGENLLLNEKCNSFHLLLSNESFSTIF